MEINFIVMMARAMERTLGWLSLAVLAWKMASAQLLAAKEYEAVPVIIGQPQVISYHLHNAGAE